jgi:hypothetical protein
VSATEEQRWLSLSEADALLNSLGRALTVKQSRSTGRRHAVWRYCDDDAILFLGAFGDPWTAWLEREGGTLTSVRFERGWSACPGSCGRVSTGTPVTASRGEREVRADDEEMDGA